MDKKLFESTPVIYNTSSLKTLSFDHKNFSDIIRMHWHDRMEFLRIKSGNGIFCVGTESYSATKGDVVIIPPKTLHNGFSPQKNIKYDVVMFDVRSFYNETDICKKLLPAIFEGNAVLKPVTSHPDTVKYIDFLCSNPSSEGLELISCVYQLLNSLLKNELIELRATPRNTVVRKITEYMENHFTEDLTVRELCSVFGYTESHFCRKFKKSTGLSPISYLTIIRLEYAGKLIKSGNESINHIASESGFSDSNYFTRCFKKHFGMSPTEYRKKRLK